MSKHLKLNLSFYCLLLTAAFIINHVENRLFHEHLLFIVSFNIIVDIIFRLINSNLLSSLNGYYFAFVIIHRHPISKGWRKPFQAGH